MSRPLFFERCVTLYLAELQEAAAQRTKQAALESQAQELKAQAQEDVLAERRERLKEIDNVRPGLSLRLSAAPCRANTDHKHGRRTAHRPQCCGLLPWHRKCLAP